MARPASASDQQPAAEVARTLQALDSAVADTSLASISSLGIDQVRSLKREVAEIFPASNLPAFILSGLMNLRGRSLERSQVAADLRVLFRETQQLGVYGTFLVAPALIIAGYQRLLTLAGKDLASAFPDGTWQFYTEFGLREDAARHSVETVGFQRVAGGLSDADAATCWVYAALHTLFIYEDLLGAEWHERTMMRCIELAIEDIATEQLGRRLPRKAEERARAVATAAAELRAQLGLQRLAAEWVARRPYAGPADDPLDGYIAARRRAFDAYLERRLADAPPGLRARATARYEVRRPGLPAFLAQLSLNRTLRPDTYSERREPLPFEGLCASLFCGDAYHLIELCERDERGQLLITSRDGDPTRPGYPLPLTRSRDGEVSDRYGQPVQINGRGEVRVAGSLIGRLRRAPLALVRAGVAAALRARPPTAIRPGEPLTTDTLLATAPRARQEHLRTTLGAQSRSEIEALRRAPIIVNWNRHDASQPLGELRRTRRGCGDHALTLLRTERSMVFDLSHIFFDGAWGSALAELITGFASATARSLPPGRPLTSPAPPALTLATSPAFLRAATAAAAEAPPETVAESAAVNLGAISALRRRLADREIELTVNDLLLLARWEHAANYQPGAEARAALDTLAASGHTALAERIDLELEAARATPPTLLIPMDASGLDPRERLHPAALRNPQPDLLPRLARCETLLRTLSRGDPAERAAFEAERTALCGNLLRFGAVLRALREITTRGESFATAALRLLGHLPRPLQSLLDLIPQKIDLLNELVKGSEVFSNIGQVAPGSSLTRFMSSRDDGDTKVLIWGVMTDADGRMVVTLRDFRPHVGPLLRAGQAPLATMLTADYLAAYTATVNALVRRIQRVLAARTGHGRS